MNLLDSYKDFTTSCFKFGKSWKKSPVNTIHISRSNHLFTISSKREIPLSKICVDSSCTRIYNRDIRIFVFEIEKFKLILSTTSSGRNLASSNSGVLIFVIRSGRIRNECSLFFIIFDGFAPTTLWQKLFSSKSFKVNKNPFRDLRSNGSTPAFFFVKQ